MNNLRDIFLKFCAALVAAAAIVGGAAKENKAEPTFKKSVAERVTVEKVAF